MTTKTHKYYIFTVTGLAIFIFVALGRELFYGLPLDETFAVLSDCSFIAGVLLARIRRTQLCRVARRIRRVRVRGKSDKVALRSTDGLQARVVL